VILVTGGAGLVGSALTAALRARGAEVAGTSHSGRPGLLPLDLADPAAAPLPEGVETAVLCAWQGGVDACAADPAGTAARNVAGNIALATRLRSAGARVIFLSTSLVFAAPPSAPRSPVTPCCEYARQKVFVEAALDPARDAVVRVTKVAETLLPRLKTWAAELRAGRPVRVASAMKIAPVPLSDVASALASLALEFEPGVFQMSAARDVSYGDVAVALASRLGASPDLLLNAPPPGRLFDPVPVSGALEIAGPAEGRYWPGGADAMQSLVEQAIS
jgi:nucleoside-diphosphate-sugar epimerase